MPVPVLRLLVAGVCTLAAASPSAAGQRPSAPPPPPPATTTRAPVRQAPARPAATTAPPNPAPPPVPAAAAAAAQRWRAVVTVSGLLQPAQHDFTDTRAFIYDRETATVDTDYKVERGGGIDGGAFVRVWRQLGVGASVTSVRRTSDATILASYPHPFFFGQQRLAQTSVNDLGRSELGVHLSAAWLLPTTGRFGGVVYAGPSVFAIRQDVVETLAVIETYPYDTVTIAPGGDPTRLSERAVGVHVGADVAWYFSSRLGIGAMARYSTATTDVAIGAGNDLNLGAGGFQAGLGLRLRF